MQGGGFSVSGNAIVNDLGQGVLLYNAPINSNDGINFSGTGKISLTPLTTGAWQGLVMFQARNSTAQINITGNGAMTIYGTIYAAGSTINIIGNGGVDANGNPVDVIGSMLIADALLVSGNGTFVVKAM